MVSLLLCGVVSAQTHFTAPNAYLRSSNTPIVAAVTVDNAAPATGAELAVYVGNELRGLATSEEFVDGNFWVQVYYNTGSSETLTFKLWNPAGEGTELDTYTLTYDGLTELTTCEEGYGTPGAPVQLAFTATQTQTTNLAAGWTWWSSYVEIVDGSAALTNLENSLGNAGNQILSADGFVNRNEFMGYVFWDGSFDGICNEQMYKIQTNASCNASISGQLASLAEHPITLVGNSWNWIGFPSTQSMSIADAFQGITPEPGDQIKGTDGFATYETYMSFGYWDGTLNTLDPGKGYMYKSNSSDDKTFIYNTTSRGENEIAPVVNNDYTFEPLQGSYANNMTVTAIVELDGEELRSNAYEVAVFVGNECRGSVKLMYVEHLDRFEAFLLISGDKEESMRFVLTDGIEASWSDDYLTYTTDGIVGSPSKPVTLHFGPLGVSDNINPMVNVYPNPSKDVFCIEGKDMQKIEVINSYGQIILSQEIENDFLRINLNGKANGIYMLRVITKNGNSINKLIKE